MGEFYNIIILAIVSGVLVIILRQTKPEMSVLLGLVIGVILLLAIVNVSVGILFITVGIISTCVKKREY